MSWGVDALFELLAPVLELPWIMFASEETFVSTVRARRSCSPPSRARRPRRARLPMHGRLLDAVEAPFISGKLPSPALDAGVLPPGRGAPLIAESSKQRLGLAYAPAARAEVHRTLEAQLTRNEAASTVAQALLHLRGTASVPASPTGVRLLGDAPPPRRAPPRARGRAAPPRSSRARARATPTPSRSGRCCRRATWSTRPCAGLGLTP